MSVNDKRELLITKAREVCGRFDLAADFYAGDVGAALLTESGNMYTGICIDVASGIGFCAEHAAIAEMLKHRETRIDIIVAVTEQEILAPCGRCREFMALINKKNMECTILLEGGREKPLKELLPDHWLFSM